MATVTERKPGVWLARAFLPPSADGPGRAFLAPRKVLAPGGRVEPDDDGQVDTPNEQPGTEAHGRHSGGAVGPETTFAPTFKPTGATM